MRVEKVEVIYDSDMGEFQGLFNFIPNDIDNGVHNLETVGVWYEGVEVTDALPMMAMQTLLDLARDEVKDNV